MENNAAPQELKIFGQYYQVTHEGNQIRVTAESGEAHSLVWHEGRLTGPAYSRVTSEFRAHLAAILGLS
jgi:hypothetical protein